MLVVIPTCGSNISSVTNSLDRLEIKYCLSESPEVIKGASRVLLPGVGAAESAMRRLKRADLVECIRGLTQPVLGICLGMQLLFEFSDECEGPRGRTECLGVIPGTIKRIIPPENESVPHMGWNSVTECNAGTKLLVGINDGSFFYFVHSFASPNGSFVRGSTNYGGSVPAIVQNKNFYGAQFHPERSAKAGAQLIRNFIGIET